MKLSILIAMLGTLVCLGSPSLHSAGSGGNLKFSATINVLVSGPEGVKSRVASALRNDLRSLSGVSVVEKGAAWTLSVLVLQPTTRGGQKGGGYFYSVVLLSSQSTALVDDLLNDSRLKDDKDTLAMLEAQKILLGSFAFADHWCFISSEDGLKATCGDIVAGIDDKHFEPVRQRFVEMNKNRSSSSK